MFYHLRHLNWRFNGMFFLILCGFPKEEGEYENFLKNSLTKLTGCGIVCIG